MNKNTIDTTIQLSHLLSSNIYLQSIEATIVDTIIEANNIITLQNIKSEIKNKFKVDIGQDKIQIIINKLVNENKLYFDGNTIIVDSQFLGEVSIMIKQNQDIEDEAIYEWIQSFRNILGAEITEKDISTLKESILRYIRRFFLSHGADSFSLLFDNSKSKEFDINNLVEECLGNVSETLKPSAKALLLNIFSNNLTVSQKAFCIQQIKKAVSYLSMVADSDVKRIILDQVNGLTIYLDTPILYRLLNLQGASRYNTIKMLLDFCKSSDIRLKIFQTTFEELKRRISYDAKVILQYPTPRAFSEIGYRCRTSDNYISTFWEQNKETGISPKDFNFLYSDLKSLIESHQIEIDTNNYIEEYNLESDKNNLYHKVFEFSNSDDEYCKSINSIDHDATCLAIIEKIRVQNASSVIDSKVLFLTSDWSLIKLQRYDFDYKDKVDFVLLPSQIMQLFCLAQATDSFYESFLGMFSSSKAYFGTKQLSNKDIQEILGRIAVYKVKSPSFAEKVLSNQLIQATFSQQENEEQQFALIDDTICIEVENMQKELENKVTELENNKKKFNLVMEDSIQKEELIKDLGNRVTMLEDALKNESKEVEDKDEIIKSNSKYEEHIRILYEKKSRNKALIRFTSSIIFIVFGTITLLISIIALIPTFSPIAKPCFNWISTSEALKNDPPNNSTIITILLAISAVLIAIGIPLAVPGYSKLKENYFNKYISKI